ncbi:MAG: bifunctional diguanylate cyclase/phosphodiesterase [Pseudomonadota bacterium]
MVKGQPPLSDAQRPLSERSRSGAFWVGSLGLVILAFVYVGFAASGEANLIMTAETTVYAILLGAIVISARREFHVKTVLNISLLIMLAIFWLSSFAESYYSQTTPLDVPLVLFVPLFLAIMLSYKALFSLSIIQFFCVFGFMAEFGVQAVGADWPRGDQLSFSLMMAVFSSFSFCALGVVAVARERADQKLFKLIDEKDALAATDVLTGLINRRAFMETLRTHWSDRQRIRIAFLDLDHFKPLNDQYGHAVGDHILCATARRLECFPNVTASARLGGDEFAVLFDEDLDDQPVDSLLSELHAAVTAEIDWESGLIPMAVSMGYVDGDPVKQSLSGLLRMADTAMRRAKTGRLGWAIFNPEIDNATLATSTLEVELKLAIKTGQIKAAVQPIADAKTRQIEAYEVLARWTDSGFDRDPSPVEFIPIAEKLGLLNEMLWVTLREALSHTELSPRRLAINVSPAQLLASDFMDTLLGILKQYDAPTSAITIEITEEVAYRNVERNVAVLEQARALGMTIALDDFGTGYSSLSMLDVLPLDKLKIDQSFVRKSDQSERSKRILLAAIRLARQLGLQSCVEGIETQQNAARMAVLGADLIQGYWIGRPQLVRDAKAEMRLAS